jgi:hypothetical protein
MVTIGNDTLPGTITTLESAASTGANVGAPGTPVLVGQGYLSDGSANAAEAHRITRPKEARDLFGAADKSMLTQATQDALVEGAYPVYAIAATENDVSSEDLSGTSAATFSLANAPVQEVAGDISFTINSTSKTTVLYYDGDPANATPGTDEVLVNPVTGKCHADESAGNSGDEVSYTHLTYSNALDEITNHETEVGPFLREVVDFIGALNENDSVVSDVKTKAEDMESNGYLAIAQAGAGDPYIDDVNTQTDEIGSYSHSDDTSRLQYIHPSRDDENNTIMGSWVGLRARYGISRSPIFTRMRNQSALRDNLSTSQQEDLVLANVNPIDESGDGARVIEDLTTVADSNSTESSWKQGSARLITDFVAETVDAESEAFVGQFNDTAVLNSLRSRLSSELNDLLFSRSIEAYSIIIEEVDATTVAVDIGINTADPLRNIELTVSAGAVQNGVTVESE